PEKIASLANRSADSAGAAKLISVDESESLGVGQVHDLYRRFVDPNQVALMTSFGFGRELIDRAEGVWLYTRAGRPILDFASGAAGFGHGHNHPRIVAARARFASQRRMEVHKTYFSPYVAALGHNLAHVLPGDLSLSFLPNSGAEAIEGAVKLAYKYHQGRRHTVLRADIARHGELLGSGSLSTGEPGRYPGIPGVLSYRYDDLPSVRAAVAAANRGPGRNDVYAILVEPFSATTLRSCSASFLRGLRQLCTAEDIVLVFDEVRTGWGRTGTLFYFMRHEGLVPDVLVTGQAFGGGKSSVCAYVAREKVFRTAYDHLADALTHSTSTTYYGFGEENATAIEAINVVVEDDYPARARAIEQLLAPGLARIADRFPDTVREVRGHGASFGVVLDGGEPTRELARKSMPGGLGGDSVFGAKLAACAVASALYRDHGLCVHYDLDGGNPLIIGPQLVAEPEHVELFLDGFEATLAKGLPRLLTTFLSEKVTTLW
ncbi:MAG TPA: aminotransferase class III-fold pyridoxal phosphate-dependent enzyme, partial [Pseudonocardiaceae bacterium]